MAALSMHHCLWSLGTSSPFYSFPTPWGSPYHRQTWIFHCFTLIPPDTALVSVLARVFRNTDHEKKFSCSGFLGVYNLREGGAREDGQWIQENKQNKVLCAASWENTAGFFITRSSLRTPCRTMVTPGGRVGGKVGKKSWCMVSSLSLVSF